NSIREVDERYGQIFLLEGKAQKPVEQATPGEIIAIAKLKETATGDTLCTRANPVIYPFVDIQPPVLTYAIRPKTRGDEEKITQVLARLKEEDPTLAIQRDQQTGELLIAGNGQIHIDVTIEKMERKFGVQVELALPKIPYHETIKAAQKGVIYRHKKQTGGAGQFAEVHFDITPLSRGAGFEFEEALVGMNVPRNFVPAVEKGLHEALQSGPLAGLPVVDIKVRFYDGKSHEVDSSETAFKIAAIQCFRKGVLDAKPTILEPIVKMTIEIPDNAVGDVIGDLNSRRGRVMGMEPGQDGRQVITALVPMAEVQRYVLDLNALTAGRGTFSMEISHYEEVPGNLLDKLIAKINEERGKGEK
ncbi:MAG: elongation factor G, partial [Dissulfurimicrobium sp.]